MSYIAPLTKDQATGKTAELFGALEKKLKRVPNLLAAMGHSSAVLEGYMNLGSALGRSSLDAKAREAITLRVSELNECGYCIAAHTAIGKGAGLTDEQCLEARHGNAEDPRLAAILHFAGLLVEHRGHVSSEDVEALRTAGLTEGEVLEVTATAVLSMYTNYLHHVTRVAIDFPAAPKL